MHLYVTAVRMLIAASRAMMKSIAAIAVLALLSHVSVASKAETNAADGVSSEPAGDTVPSDVAALIATAEAGEGDNRRRAIVELGELGARGLPAVPLLIRTLSDRDQNLRHKAILALEHLGPYATPAVPALIQMLEDSDGGIRDSTVYALKRIGDQRAIAPLTSLLRGRSSEDFTAELALYAILQIGGQPEIPFLLQVLNEPSNNSLARGAAAYFLGESRLPEAITALLAIATNRSEPSHVRACAIKGLRHVRDLHVIEAATTVLFDRTEERKVRIGAACVLSDLAGRDAVDKLAAVVRDTADDVQVRFWAAIDLVFILDGALDDVEIARALRGDPPMFILRWEGLAYQQLFDVRRAALHAVNEHGQTPAVQSVAARLLGELVPPTYRYSTLTDHCNSPKYDGPCCYAWAALYFVIALGVLGAVYAYRLARRRFPIVPIAVFLILTAICAFGMGIKSLYEATHLPGVESHYDAQDPAQCVDPEWETAATCEKSWVDDTCDDLPRRYPIEFRGRHYWIPHEYWRSPNRYLPSERLQQILTGGVGKGTATTEATNDKSDQNGGKSME